MAAELINNDYLKKVVNRTEGQGTVGRSKYAARQQHSCFGDFPKDYMSKTSKNQDLNIGVHEASQAATASSKCDPFDILR